MLVYRFVDSPTVFFSSSFVIAVFGLIAFLPATDVVHMMAGLTKNAIFRLTKNHLQFVIKERAVYGGVSAWCEIDHVSNF